MRTSKLTKALLIPALALGISSGVKAQEKFLGINGEFKTEFGSFLQTGYELKKTWKENFPELNHLSPERKKENYPFMEIKFYAKPSIKIKKMKVGPLAGIQLSACEQKLFYQISIPSKDNDYTKVQEKQLKKNPAFLAGIFLEREIPEDRFLEFKAVVEGLKTKDIYYKRKNSNLKCLGPIDITEDISEVSNEQTMKRPLYNFSLGIGGKDEEDFDTSFKLDI